MEMPPPTTLIAQESVTPPEIVVRVQRKATSKLEIDTRERLHKVGLTLLSRLEAAVKMRKPYVRKKGLDAIVIEKLETSAQDRWEKKIRVYFGPKASLVHTFVMLSKVLLELEKSPEVVTFHDWRPSGSEIDITPRNEVALTSLGQVALAKGDYMAAEERFRKTLEINPRNEVAPLMLAKLYLHRGEFSQALKTIHDQLKQHLNVATLNVLKVMVESGIGGRSEQNYYDQTLTFAKQQGMISEHLVRSLARGQTVAFEPTILSPAAFEKIEKVIGEVARSKIFQADSLIPTPVDSVAARVEFNVDVSPHTNGRGRGW